MTRTIAPIAPVAPSPSLAPDGDRNAVMDAIIADFRVTMVAIKCAGSERLLRLGVSLAQLNILYTLLRDGDMPMSRLADILNVSLSNATGLIDRLEERGYIERSRVPEDRRIVMIRLTEEGGRLLDDQDAMMDDLMRQVLGRLHPTQLAVVALATSDLRTAVDATMGPQQDRQPSSIPTPRSTTTMRADRHPAHDTHGGTHH